MSEKISSTTNVLVKDTVKLHQRKYRDEKRLFIVEGKKAIEGIYNSGFEAELFFVDEKDEAEFKHIDVKRKIIVNEAILGKISTTKTYCNSIMVVRQKDYKLKDYLDKKRLIILENIKDAGNLGTILRSCKAFDIDAVLLLGDTIDFYNPKVVRASVGCFDIPVINISYDDIKSLSKFNLYSTALHDNSIPLKKAKFTAPCVLAFGAEADGLSKDLLKGDFKNINIETSTRVESLNLASAVSICLYELFSQTI